MGFLFGIDWEKLLSNGLTPLAALIVISLVAKYAAWPYVKQYLDDARNERIEAQRILRQRAEKLEEREETVLTGFTEALQGLKETFETNSDRQQKQILMMEQILNLEKDNNDLLRGKR